jgi:hypothetical protein
LYNIEGPEKGMPIFMDVWERYWLFRRSSGDLLFFEEFGKSSTHPQG